MGAPRRQDAAAQAALQAQSLNVRFKFARTLHFKNDDAVQEQRAALVARLLEEDMRQRQAEAAVAAADKKARRA